MRMNSISGGGDCRLISCTGGMGLSVAMPVPVFVLYNSVGLDDAGRLAWYGDVHRLREYGKEMVRDGNSVYLWMKWQSYGSGLLRCIPGL